MPPKRKASTVDLTAELSEAEYDAIAKLVMFGRLKGFRWADLENIRFAGFARAVSRQRDLVNRFWEDTFQFMESEGREDEWEEAYDAYWEDRLRGETENYFRKNFEQAFASRYPTQIGTIGLVASNVAQARVKAHILRDLPLEEKA